MANRVKERIAAGHVTCGVWAEAFDPDLIELCGYLGFQYVVFDAEDTYFDHVRASLLFRACEVAEMVPMVRIPEINASLILRYLEQGAKGIYVPHIKTADDARAVVDAVRFRPLGHRTAGASRWARFGLGGDFEELFRQANADNMVIALVEEPEGIENLDEIVGVEGVDVFGIGPGDLSLALGHVGQRNHPVVRNLVVESEAKIRDAGKVFDAVVGTVEEARDCIDRGALMVSYALRDMVLHSGRNFLSEIADYHTKSVRAPAQATH